MANNLTAAIPSITLRILGVLRENARMVRYVNNDYSTDARQRGDTVDITITNSLSTREVAPAITSSLTGLNDIIPTRRQISLDQWHEVAFPMTDKELREVQEGLESRVLDEAVKALVNKVDTDLLSLYRQVYNFTGTAGTTPFASSTASIQSASRILTTGLADKTNRYAVVDEYAMANAIGLDIFRRVDASGQSDVLRMGTLEGMMGYGFMWSENQNTLTHDTNATGTYAIDAAALTGATTIVVDDGAGAAPTSLIIGDKFTIAGSDQQYTVTAVSAGSPTANEDTYTISPALDQDVADGDALTVVDTDYTANLFFHRDAFGFASRPLLDLQVDAASGVFIQNIPDPLSGMNLRLEITRQNKQWQFSLDILYGFGIVRPELACVVLG